MISNNHVGFTGTAVGGFACGSFTTVDALELVCVVWSLTTLATFTIEPLKPVVIAKVNPVTVTLCPTFSVPRLQGNAVQGAPTLT